MAKKVEIKLNRAAVRELMKSQEVRALTEQYASQIAMSAGDGFETRTHNSDQRVITNVYAGNAAASRDNLKNNTLLKAMRAAKNG